MKKTIFLLAAVAAAFVVQPAFADADAGKKVFNKCKACHDAEKEVNKVGPHLVGIIGRPVGSVEGFKYSKANQEFGADGKVWDEELLKAYLAKPRDVVKGTTMAFAGLKKEEEITNILEYFKSLAQ